MSTTTTFQGLDESSKPSSRVLNPPGGGSSNIFGFAGDDNPPPQRKQQASAASQPSQPPPTSQSHEPPQRSRGSKAAVNPITGEPLYQPNQTKSQDASAEGTEGSKSSEVTGGGAASAGQPAQSQKPSDSIGSLMAAGRPSNEVSSTRVSQPPGGRSTKLW